MTTEQSAARKDIQKLQRAIVDGLEDVKGHDIQVFDTEHLSPLFERVIVASGTSNRQTKALAASVRDAVREAGFVKPRVEGEENGEWIIVDCGAAVAHIMQPTFRQYYRLEDLWGDKPVRLRLGAPKPAQTSHPVAKKAAATKKPAAKAATNGGRKTAPRKTVADDKSAVKKAPARKAAVKKVAGSKVATKKAAARKAPAAAGKAPARQSPAAKR